jgi:hypothetical protein
MTPGVRTTANDTSLDFTIRAHDTVHLINKSDLRCRASERELSTPAQWWWRPT